MESVFVPTRGKLRMDSHSRKQRVVDVLLVVVCVAPPAFGTHVYTYGRDFNMPILDKPGPGSSMTEAIIEVADSFVISDLDVRVYITHSNVFDLQLFLQSPGGTRLCLNMYDFRDFFKGADYANTVFDDEAAIPIEQAEPPFTGRFRPKAIEPLNKLDVFDGENTCGIWRLQIYDMWDWDTGTLDRFELIFTTPEPSTGILLIFAVGLVTLKKRAMGR